MDLIHKVIGGKTIEIFYENPRFIHEVIDANEYEGVFNDLVVIDLGANIGSFSFWIYDRAKIIYALEPVPGCIEMMSKTKQAGGLDKLNIYQLAISGLGGDREFLLDPSPTGGGGKLDPNPFPTDNRTIVKTKTMKQFMEDEGIQRVDILKIDVEGGEKEIFQRPGFRDVADKIKTIVGEYHQYDPTEDLELCGYTVYMDTEHSKFVARRK